MSDAPLASEQIQPEGGRLDGWSAMFVVVVRSIKKHYSALPQTHATAAEAEWAGRAALGPVYDAFFVLSVPARVPHPNTADVREPGFPRPLQGPVPGKAAPNPETESQSGIPRTIAGRYAGEWRMMLRAAVPNPGDTIWLSDFCGETIRPYLRRVARMWPEFSILIAKRAGRQGGKHALVRRMLEPRRRLG